MQHLRSANDHFMTGCWLWSEAVTCWCIYRKSCYTVEFIWLIVKHNTCIFDNLSVLFEEFLFWSFRLYLMHGADASWVPFMCLICNVHLMDLHQTKILWQSPFVARLKCLPPCTLANDFSSGFGSTDQRAILLTVQNNYSNTAQQRYLSTRNITM